LFYPEGSPGFQWKIKQQDGRRDVTVMQYYKYRLMERTGQFNVFLHGGHLFQQWVTDMYCKMEAHRLMYFKSEKNKNKLRIGNYKSVQEYLARGQGTMERVGRPIILPSTFPGSPRNMRELYQDAMGNVRRFGRPDLFITATGSGGWDEIQNELKPGQIWSDRPDLVARVCSMKFEKLIKHIKNGLLGEVQYYFYTIEYQKRGMPHIHLLVKFVKADRLSTPAHIDAIITAKVPNEFEDAVYYGWVTAEMVHGPCGVYNPSMPCCLDGDGKLIPCVRGYPKDLCEETTMGERSYAIYARPAGHSATVGRRHIDNVNQWIVPHNRALLTLMDGAHINVESVGSIKSCKYIFKYSCKGEDRAILTEEGTYARNPTTIRNLHNASTTNIQHLHTSQSQI
jgi:hypothetical protein